MAFDGIGGSGNDRTKLNFNTDDTDRLLPLTVNGSLSALLDELNVLLMSGQMDAGMKNSVTTAITTAIPTVTTVANQRDRLRTAVHLIITSPQFSTQR